MRTIPRILSIDDHVIEPPDLWQRYLPAKHRDRGPRVVNDHHSIVWVDGIQTIRRGGDGAKTDFWIYEDLVWSHQMLNACAGYDESQWWMGPISFEQMRPGCYEPKARLADMDLNHMEGSLCFPTFPRFCGQMFSERKDKELALAGVRAYNDWMVEEWSGAAPKRLIPLCIVPLWDPALAAAEVRRNAARGVRAVAFSELPGKLGLPTIHDPKRHWEPFLAACAETGTAIFMHIGSGSTFLTSSADAPPAVTATLGFLTTSMALSDWLFSGALARYPDLRVCFAEGQIGWIPYALERADTVWEHHDIWMRTKERIPEPPSTYYWGRIFGCFTADHHGLANLDSVGVNNICFETDYPHTDTTWPHTQAYVEKILAGIDDDVAYRVLRGNAIDMLSLDRT